MVPNRGHLWSGLPVGVSEVRTRPISVGLAVMHRQLTSPPSCFPFSFFPFFFGFCPASTCLSLSSPKPRIAVTRRDTAFDRRFQPHQHRLLVCTPLIDLINDLLLSVSTPPGDAFLALVCKRSLLVRPGAGVIRSRSLSPPCVVISRTRRHGPLGAPSVRSLTARQVARCHTLSPLATVSPPPLPPSRSVVACAFSLRLRPRRPRLFGPRPSAPWPPPLCVKPQAGKVRSIVI